MSCIHRNILG